MKNTITRTPLIMACLAFLIAPDAMAQDSAKPPLEITADNSLEWLRGEQKLIARGKALASQETSSIAAETLTALYRNGEGGRFEIYEMTATQDVVIRSQNTSAYGDQAVYNVDQGQATMTGDDLRMISPDQSVTARESFQYNVNEGKLIAVGNAIATRLNINGGSDTLRADTLSAVFKEDANGDRVLDTLEARGNVVITTPTEKATGAYGIYRSTSNKAELTGGVVITRGPNILEGQRAEVDLTTNTSRIFGDETISSGRVKAVFYPGSE